MGLANIFQLKPMDSDELYADAMLTPTPTPEELEEHQGSREEQVFIMELGRALHAYGTPAHQLEDALTRVAARLGLIAQFLTTPTSITASFGPLGNQQLAMMRVDPGVTELGKLAELDAIAGKVLRAECSPQDGSVRIASVVARPRRFGPKTIIAAHAVASTCTAAFFGGSALDIGVASVVGMTVGAMSVHLYKKPETARILEPLAALVAAIIAGLAGAFIPSLTVYIITIAGLIALVPGLTLTLAMTELATRNLVSGTARLMNAALIFLQLGFGVALGQKLAGLLSNQTKLGIPAYDLPLWAEITALAVLPIAFGVLFQARVRDLFPILVAGIFGFLGARAGALLFGPQLGAFFGALVVASFSNIVARKLDRPASILLVPGILLLVPGSIGFRSMTAMLSADVISGVETAFSMILVAISLVAGLLLANVLVPARRAL